MEFSILKIIFMLISFFIVFLGALINCLEKHLPPFFIKIFRYGKFAYKGKDGAKVIEVPKSWFKHFYVYSSAIISVAMYFTIKSYFMNENVPTWIKGSLDFLGGNNRTSTATVFSTFVALALLTIQCYRRFYDTQFVSIFGSKSKMNLGHYLVGFVHYTGAILAILAEAPNFQSTNVNTTINIREISVTDVLGTILFIWAWCHQFVVTKILANLRKNPKGKAVSEKHFLPNGDWFEYVSSPHSLAEILMYIAITIILKNNSTWLYVCVWVIVNQIETSLLCHWWYKDTFKNFPKQRKAIIPYIL